MSSQKFITSLVQPSKVAAAMDWRKTSGKILTLNIHKDGIGMVLASHPSSHFDVRTLDSLPLLSKSRVPTESKEALGEVLSDHNVCGVVVSWPLQSDTGKMGAACGRVINVMDSLFKDERNDKKLSAKLNARAGSICLWNSVPPIMEHTDVWGRNPAFGRPTQKIMHVASLEQYNQSNDIVAAQVWDDFVKAHWPDIYERYNRERTSTQPHLYLGAFNHETILDDDDDVTMLGGNSQIAMSLA